MPRVYVETNEKGEVIAWATSRGNDKEIELELDDAHTFFTGSPFFHELKDGVLTENHARKDEARQRRKNEAEIRELKGVLAETDFYFIRQMDDKTPVPPDIRVKRAKARTRLRELGL